MSWRSRLENTQNHTPEDLGMSELAHKDVGEAVERIKELEQQIDELLVDAHKFKECISENMRTIGGLKQQLEGADDVNLRLKMEFIAAMQEVERLREALEEGVNAKD